MRLLQKEVISELFFQVVLILSFLEKGDIEEVNVVTNERKFESLDLSTKGDQENKVIN